MGLFGNLFGKPEREPQKEERKVPWIPLTSLHQLEGIKEKSIERPQVIFKHSTTCGISRMVLNTFVRNYDFTRNRLDLYYLDLHSNREVSNETAYMFQVTHQSPQLLVIRNGTVVAHSSHGGINDMDLDRYL